MEQQYKNDFVRELLFNNSISFQDLIERGKEHQFCNEKNYACILFTTGNEEDKNKGVDVTKVSRIDYVIRQRWPNAIVGSIREHICIIFPIDNKTKKRDQASM
ncbi:hypothetical protein RWE15_15000 [Virgibacillus halophilus]|uniref:Uncharacterized protein n=1 Tax=Tigheibacillus halophilus TaxID=361280 RepID=A0ABU5C832_9BACI|nr:hypothetical protein [Virgibacillus halophilus]